MKFVAKRGMIYALECCAAVSIWLVFCETLHAQLHTLTPDANSIYLYHFNEAAGGSSAANSGSAGLSAISYDGDPYAGDGLNQTTVTTVLGGAGFSGFGNAANVSAVDLGLGVDRNGNGMFMLDDSAPISTEDRATDHSTIFGPGNVFTLEAMVNVPAIASNRHIISSDNAGGAADRGFQFRMNAAGALEFNFIGGTGGAYTVPIPTTGDNAFVANEWFHAAAAYNGSTVQLYWTRVNASVSAAAPLGASAARGVDVVDDMFLSIGNESRVLVAVGSTEGLVGLIDEVRISNISRGAAEFIFGINIVPGDVDGDQVPDIDDFNIIKMNLFKTGQTRMQGDIAGGDGIVDFADYRQWKTAAAPAIAAGASLFGTAPEPSTCFLLAAGGMLLAATRRRQRKSLRWVS